MIIFDVGANNGSTCMHLAAQHPENTVYAFEPTPQLVEVLRDRSRGLANYIIVPKAVSNYSGRATFNVAGQADWGCSSLRQFNTDLERVWPGRTDFKVTHTIDVEVIRLYDFVVERGISQIDYLHVDVQGEDLNVLRGLGDKLAIVRQGDVETANSEQVALYQGQDTLPQIQQFLTENGFVIHRMQANDVFRNEINVFFARTPEAVRG